jgi:ferrochelatase
MPTKTPIEFKHDRVDLTAVVLVNLGTPEAPTVGAVRRYLAEFLSDPRVIELPRWLWWLILHGVILRLRPRRSAHAYASIWQDSGSPLMSHSLTLGKAVAAKINPNQDPAIEVAVAMRYGSPSLPTVLGQLKSRGLRRLAILPLYPQYSATTTASVFDAVTRELQQWRFVPELRFIQDYWSMPDYLQAIATQIQTHQKTHGVAEKTLFSFHGIPQRYFRQGDPYYCQCLGTARRVAQLLGLESSQWAVAFQSRVGREPWLKPYTDYILREWAQTGVRSVHVVCPGFAVDCLETLEEIALQNRDLFLSSGGQQYAYIPALNADEDHAHLLTKLIRSHTRGWPGFDGDEPLDPKTQAQIRDTNYLSATDPFSL